MRIPAEYRFPGETVEVEWSDELDALVVRSSSGDRMAPFFEYLDKRPLAAPTDFYPVDANGRFDLIAYFAESDAV